MSLAHAITRYTTESPFDIAFFVLGAVDVLVGSVAAVEYVRLLIIAKVRRCGVSAEAVRVSGLTASAHVHTHASTGIEA